jgi:hypothetical protein
MQRGRAVSPWSQVRPTTESATARFEAEPSTLEVVGFLASERHHEKREFWRGRDRFTRAAAALKAQLARPPGDGARCFSGGTSEALSGL